MKKIEDENLINEFNAPPGIEKTPGKGEKQTDISSEEQQNIFANLPFLPRQFGQLPIAFMQGARKGAGEISQIPPEIINYISSKLGGKEFMPVPSPDVFTGKDLLPQKNILIKSAEFGGELLPYILGGETGGAALGSIPAVSRGIGVLSNLGKAIDMIPKLGGITKALGGAGKIAERALGGEIIGRGVGSEEHPELSGHIGALLNVLLPNIPKGIKKGISGLRISPIMENIEKLVGKESVGKTIEQGKKPYKEIVDKVPKESIYPPEIEQLSSASDERGYPTHGYLRFKNDKLESIYKGNTNLSDIHKNFEKTPTFQNAQELKTQLGDEIHSLFTKKLKVGRLEPAEESELFLMKKAANILNNDMHEFLRNKDPELLNKFIQANKNWRENVEPLRKFSAMFESKVKGGAFPEVIPKNILGEYTKYLKGKRQEIIPQYVTQQVKSQLDRLNEIMKRRKFWGIGSSIGVAAPTAIGIGKGLLNYLKPREQEPFIE